MEPGAPNIIYLEEFIILNVQNHYPSGTPDQRCSSVIRIIGHELEEDGKKVPRIVEVKFQNFPLKEDPSTKLIKEVVPAPRFDGETLYLDQPMASLPIWQMVLTTLESDSYYIGYEHKSHAFLEPVAGVSHKVGGKH